MRHCVYRILDTSFRWYDGKEVFAPLLTLQAHLRHSSEG